MRVVRPAQLGLCVVAQQLACASLKSKRPANTAAPTYRRLSGVCRVALFRADVPGHQREDIVDRMIREAANDMTYPLLA